MAWSSLLHLDQPCHHSRSPIGHATRAPVRTVGADRVLLAISQVDRLSLDPAGPRRRAVEEIHRRSRVDLADRRPVAHPDRKRSPRVAVEFGIRKQRLLTTLRPKRAFLRSAQYELHSQGGRLALARRLPSRRTDNPADEAICRGYGA